MVLQSPTASVLGASALTAPDLLNLLTRYRMLPQFHREQLIDHITAPIPSTPDETELAQQRFYATHHLTTESELQSYLTRYHFTATQLTEIALRDLKLEKFKHATWGHKLEAHFLTHKAQFDQVIYSLLRTSDPEVIQELYFRIKVGEQTFSELAQEYSEGAEAQTGGLLGPVPLTVPHPVIAQKLRTCQPGYLLPPTQFGDWYVLLRLEKRLPAQLDDAMRQRLLDDLFEQWVAVQP